MEFRKRFCQKRTALFKSGQWHFHQDNTLAYNLVLVIEYLTKMGIKTVLHPVYSPDLAPCDFWLFPKLRGCRYETIEEMKEAVTKVIDTLTQEDFHAGFQKLLERYNKCIAAGGDYFEGDSSFTCVLSIRVPIRKKGWKLIVCTSYNFFRIFYTSVWWESFTGVWVTTSLLLCPEPSTVFCLNSFYNCLDDID